MLKLSNGCMGSLRKIWVKQKEKVLAITDSCKIDLTDNDLNMFGICKIATDLYLQVYPDGKASGIECMGSLRKNG
jgi:hypothetical protein